MAKFTPLDARQYFKSRLFMMLGLRRKPIQVGCEHCGKVISSDLEWTCGYCDLENNRTKTYSFLFKCERCKQSPKCLACPYCKELLFFGGSKDGRHPAKSIQLPQLPESQEKLQAKKRQEREETKAELEFQITITRLNADLVKLKKSMEATIEIAKNKSPHEILEESFTEHDAQIMAAYKIAKREKEANNIKYADDSELLKMANLSVDDWLQRHI